MDISSLTSADMRRLTAQGSVTLFLGAGVSNWQPTNLPTGGDFTCGVFDVLFDTAGMPPVRGKDLDDLQRSFGSLPFEMLLQRCPTQSTLRGALAEMFSVDTANPVHAAVSALAASGVVHSIVTTNYDLALDTALRDAGAPLRPIVRKTLLSSRGERIYFKIHGSADDPETLVYRLLLESRLKPWKREILASCVEGRHLLLIGYSGADFEICPELAHMMPATILWNFLEPASAAGSPGYRQVCRHQHKATPLFGDMRMLLGLLGTAVTAAPGPNCRPEVARRLSSLFTSDELLLWRARVLNTIGLCRLAEQTLAVASPHTNPNIEVLYEYAQTLFQRGAYADAAAAYLRVAEATAGTDLSSSSRLSASEALRCYGSVGRSGWQVRRVARDMARRPPGDRRLHARLLRRSLWRLRGIYRLAQLIRLRPVVRWIRLRVTAVLMRAADTASETGDWMGMQSLRREAEHFDAFPACFAGMGAFAPPAGQDGYAHLGFRGGLLVDRVDRAARSPDSISIPELAESLELADRLGCHPVAWKLAVLLRRADPSRAAKHTAAFRHHFSNCQYAWPRKLTILGGTATGRLLPN
jgi:hypothetical protein